MLFAATGVSKWLCVPFFVVAIVGVGILIAMENSVEQGKRESTKRFRIFLWTFGSIAFVMMCVGLAILAGGATG